MSHIRIISGTARGQQIAVPKSDVRPTPAKVRGAIFDILQHQIEGAVVLDLYAGSGALGLEAVSRGASYVTAVDASSRVLSVISKNVRQLGFGSQFNLQRRSLPAGLFGLPLRQPADIVFSDPPYADEVTERLAKLLSEPAIVRPTTCWVHEIPSSAASELEAFSAYGWRVDRARRYGDTTLVFLTREPAEILPPAANLND
ncbi:MAG: 16S rRNA (guanine(966)-N(2))-methyltransferase RsmD [Myxococcales bacterium]|nr:16S rRNA (guanine(966)-N(2))-methyltransferase RsmD [Myxococcales bacterium]